MKKHKQNEFKIKFGGRPNEIDVYTLLESLKNVTLMLDEINNEVNKGQKIEIKIKATEKGSFLLHLGLTPVETQNLLNSLNIETIYYVIEILIGLFALRQLLKGNKPEEVNNINENNLEVKTKSGTSIIINNSTFNIYSNNVKVNDALSETFETLNANPEVKSFEITDIKEKPLLHIDNKEFEEMSVYSKTDLPEENKRVIEVLAILNIIKLVFDKDRKWDFYYRGIKISAPITDEDFYKGIDKGEKFAKGDCLEVRLMIKQEKDTSANAYKNVSYEIPKVLKHIPHTEDPKLDI